MPISASAKKSLRVARRNTEINRRRKNALKRALKNVTAETLSEAFSLIDKAVKWSIFHKNKAARLKSRLARELKVAKPAPKVSAEPTKAKTAKPEGAPKAKAKTKAAPKTKKQPAARAKPKRTAAKKSQKKT